MKVPPLTAAIVLASAVETRACPYLSGLLKDGQMESPHLDIRLSEGRALTQGSSAVGSRDKCNASGRNFCYFKMLPIPAFAAEFADLVEISSVSGSLSTFNYMEDSQARRDVLDGFDLDNLDLETGAAGYTYLGQFLSHDMNLDETSTLGEVIDPAKILNVNTAMLDLDTLYGLDGRKPLMKHGKFVIGMTDGGQARDFPRFSDGTARIVDERNDEHRIVSQIAVAFMVLHNKFYDNKVCTKFHSRRRRFKCAKVETIKTWQSVVLTDLLPNLLDPYVLEEVSRRENRLLYKPKPPRKLDMPVEFATAAYRLFHSRARGRYRLNSMTDGSEGKQRARLFDVGLEEPILTGGTKLPDMLVVEFDRFFGPKATDPTLSPKFGNVARIMDMLYSRPMMQLPIEAPGTVEDVVTVFCDKDEEPVCPIVVDEAKVCDVPVATLATLDLVRAQTLQVPGGIKTAEYVKGVGGNVTIYSMDDLESGNVFGLPEGYREKYDEVPLLLYLAHESIFEQQGRVLGRLGSRIVAETMYGVVEGSQFHILRGKNRKFTSPITGKFEVSIMDVFKFIRWL